ncbi:kinase-like domain-containing protein [Aspergillus pseudonomiae]|uniref:Kinase-like domain-containing protein n=1 Tax=Aspergillus pseudonomiae TaxID=1506151 RepID=A0A5N7CXB6_9EURO|nr:kinase-like domain-containing protein [Aspergillus pseudonomiae]KAE8398832.1 kinase-like domain-containing protein [Aspergillus pseudonomiae]
MTGGKEGSDTKLLDCDPGDLYTYSAQRWIWNEAQQLQNRYVSFDLNALIKIAEEAAGDNAVCVNISKLPEGNFNKAFLATVQDGRELLKSQIQTQDLATTQPRLKWQQCNMESLHLPVPKVITYCSRVVESKLGSEYIVMEKAQGIELSRMWESLKPRDKLSITEQIGSITSTLSRAGLPYHGSLYLRKDVSESESIKFDDTFAIGPTTGRAWFDDRRGEVDIHRGPWASSSSTMNALVKRELACVSKFSKFPRDTQQGIFNGPGGYHPTKEAKLSVLQDFLKIYQHILPKDDGLNAGIIWHNDLHSDNIFVDQDKPTTITSIIDWQAVPIYPMFLIAYHPSLIEFDGPKPERFVRPSLPENINDLNPQDKKAASELFLAQTLWLYYETQVYKEAPDLLHAFQYRETLQSELLGLVGSIFDDGEPHVQKLLADVTRDDVWRQLVGEDNCGNSRVPCPLSYTEHDLVKQSEEYAKWERDVERKAQVINELGVYTGWNGAVSPDDYDEVVSRLKLAKKRFLDRESKTSEERVLWEKAWPFEDKASE